jgi:hypothetical protein
LPAQWVLGLHAAPCLCPLLVKKSIIFLKRLKVLSKGKAPKCKRSSLRGKEDKRKSFKKHLHGAGMPLSGGSKCGSLDLIASAAHKTKPNPIPTPTALNSLNILSE